MDGLKLVKRIRSDDTHKDVPDHHHHDRRLHGGSPTSDGPRANAYITKPIQAPQVIAKVKELLAV